MKCQRRQCVRREEKRISEKGVRTQSTQKSGAEQSRIKYDKPVEIKLKKWLSPSDAMSNSFKNVGLQF